MASRIEDYGLIGNTHTAALVGYDEHGCWSLRPTVGSRFGAISSKRRSTRRYCQAPGFRPLRGMPARSQEGWLQRPPWGAAG